jgi:hypothetical protein
MLPLSIFPVGMIVLALAACGVTALPTPRSTADPALRCVQATAPVAGSYALSIAQTGRAGQNLINQSGDFSARAGEIVELGSASLSGTAADVNATLTLDYADTALICPITITH